jgi:hypothetical protein
MSSVSASQCPLSGAKRTSLSDKRVPQYIHCPFPFRHLQRLAVATSGPGKSLSPAAQISMLRKGAENISGLGQINTSNGNERPAILWTARNFSGLSDPRRTFAETEAPGGVDKA